MTEKTPRELFQDAALWAAMNYLPLQVSFKIRLSREDEWTERSFPVIFSNGMVFSDNDEVIELLAAAQKFQFSALKDTDERINSYTQQEAVMKIIRGAIVLQKQKDGNLRDMFSRIDCGETYIQEVADNTRIGFGNSILPTKNHFYLLADASSQTNTDVHIDVNIDNPIRQTIAFADNGEENGTVLCMQNGGGYLWDYVGDKTDPRYPHLYFRSPNELPCLFMSALPATYHAAQIASGNRVVSVTTSGKLHGLEIADLQMRVIPLSEAPKNMHLILDNKTYMESRGHFRTPEALSEPFVA